MKTMHHYFRLLMCLTFLFSSQFTNAQTVKEKIRQNISEIQSAERYSPLKEVTTDELKSQIPEAVLSEKQTFQVQPKQIHSIKNNRSDYLRIIIPVAGQDVELQLIKADLFKGDFKVVAASNPDVALDVDTGNHYWGVVKDDKNSIAAMSFFKDEIVGAIHFDNQDYTIGKVKQTDYHILYKNSDLNHDLSYECETIPVNDTDDIPVTPTEKFDVFGCIKIHLEVDYTLYVGKGSSIDSTTNYCLGLLNQVLLMFANESIDMGISYLKIWDIPSPYVEPWELYYLGQQGYGRTYGDLIHLLHQIGSGGSAYRNVLCSGSLNRAESSVYGWYNNVPTYSWDVSVVTHELGHNLGSPHTHECRWNGNDTQIDDCGNKYWAEDDDQNTGPHSCYDYSNPILPPADDGTVMSYCHLIDGVGVGLANGFGTQPGDLIRSRVNNAICLNATCPSGLTCTDGQQNGNETGIDCGGPDCPPCHTCTDGILNGNEKGIDCGGSCGGCSCTDKIGLAININTDAYSSQTSWRIFDEAGSTLYARGGPYSGGIQTVVGVPCLPEGCYNFVIYDSNGNGITGTDGYIVMDEYGNTLASGTGDFDYSESTNICLESGSCTGTGFSIIINTDVQSYKTTWALTDVSGGLYYALGGPYTGGAQTVVETYCLPLGCYNFTIYDTSGNGIGTDGYTIIDEYGNTLASGEQYFGNHESTNICLQPACADVKLKFTFDDHPEETSWLVTDTDGNYVGSGGPYNLQVPNTPRTENLCLPDGCYSLLVSDSGGNGMCAVDSGDEFTIISSPGGGKSDIINGTGNSFGTTGADATGISAVDPVDAALVCGKYEVKDTNNIIIAYGGGDFGDSQNVSFCLSNGVGSIQYTPPGNEYHRTAMNDPITATMQVFPTLVKNQLTVVCTMSESKPAQLIIFDTNGTALQQQHLNADVINEQVDVRDLPPGMYFIQLIGEGMMLTEKFIKP